MHVSLLFVLLRYVLLHHVMGEIEGSKGAWAFVQGGMGSVSAAIARAAKSHGASVFVSKVRSGRPRNNAVSL